MTGILIAMVPLSIALIQRFFGVHERLGAWRIAGLGLGFIGVAALLGFGTIAGPLGWAGVACMLIATLGYAIGPLIIQRHLNGLDPYGALAASLAVASVVLLIPAAAVVPRPHAVDAGLELDANTRRVVHGAGDAADVLSRRPRRCIACEP